VPREVARKSRDLLKQHYHLAPDAGKTDEGILCGYRSGVHSRVQGCCRTGVQIEARADAHDLDGLDAKWRRPRINVRLVSSPARQVRIETCLPSPLSGDGGTEGWLSQIAEPVWVLLDGIAAGELNRHFHNRHLWSLEKHLQRCEVVFT
jgi:hypothetical protein